MSNDIYLIIEKILEESSAKKIRFHPLFIQHEDEICDLFDKTFPQFAHKPKSQKPRLLLNNHYKNLKMYKGVLCKVCSNYRRDDIRQHVLNAHNMSIADYKETYDSEVISSKTKGVYSERFEGSKNPAYNHGGKLSPFSKKFVKYANLNDDEKVEILKNISNRRVESTKENFNCSCNIDYYLARGYSEEEAKEMLQKRQATFSLEKCIQKYGYDKGRHIWKERQKKWQNTLTQKPQDEIDRINMKKSTGRMNQLFNSNDDVKHIPGTLYYIRFFNDEVEFWKIGITSRSIVERFGSENKTKASHNLNYEVLYENTSLTFYEAYKLEQKLLNKYSNERTIVNYNGFRTTEAFKENVLKNEII